MTKRGLAAKGALGPEYYDAIYDRSDRLRCHYSKSPLKGVYASAIRLLPKDKKTRILEIGCGSGQFAQNLHARGYDSYRGLDFSSSAIGLASRLRLPGRFQVGDVRDSSVLEEEKYDVVVALEVLEHLDNDLRTLASLGRSSIVILSVPTKDSLGHVRYFTTTKEVRAYYRKVLVIQHLEQVHNWFVAKGHVR